MRQTTYRFTHTCVVPATTAAVHALLVDLEHYPDWWRQVRAVASLGPDDALVVCRSVLPYDLELVLTARRRGPDCLEVDIAGPLDGSARWTLSPCEGGTRLFYEQQVTTHGRVLALASYVMKPVLRWNHARMMDGATAGMTARFS